MSSTTKFCTRLLGGAAMMSLATLSGFAHAETADFSIPPQPLDQALKAFGSQSGHSMMIDMDLVRAKKSPGVMASADPEKALQELLKGSGLTYRRSGDIFAIVAGQAEAEPRSRAAIATLAAETVSGSAVEGLVVTAQKRREQIQDVPIAISAFSADALQAQKIEGGFDLLKAIPNVTFSKNNFSGYNFSIRGIGTKAVSVTTDPGVAVAFNNITLIRNRLFEQEYFDVERVEVLRGPQGTLYGRNATSGVINLISAKADLDEFAGSIKGEVGNYNAKRLVGMVNVPLIEDVLALRIAGSTTTRDGYTINLYDNSHTDGRDLWSARLSLGFQPTEAIRADFIWERFNEDDDRSRTGKQLCTRDPGPNVIGSVSLANASPVVHGEFSQGCLPGNLYDDAAFSAPNGFALPFIIPLQAIIMGYHPGALGPGDAVTLLQENRDPYGNTTQSHDLRELYSQIKPQYRAQADVFELNVDIDVTDALTLTSQTAYVQDEIYATQDFNRYTTEPVITNTSGLVRNDGVTPARYEALAPGGFFCDPQVGCANTIVGQDLSRANSEQFSQEFRLQSNFDGPLNFSIGAGYTRYSTTEDYYVFFNGITLSAVTIVNNAPLFNTGVGPDKATLHPNCAAPGTYFFCTEIENNPISQIQDTGHNYFLSRNPYRLSSYAGFGELYWQAAETVKITAGLRYTDDKKVFTRIPSETLLTSPDVIIRNRGQAFADATHILGFPLYGLGSGYPRLPDVENQWREVTGRFGVDWKPDLSFTEETMLYAFYSRGYKGGGANPPQIGLNYDEAAELGIVYAGSAPLTFRPEFVNAFELGAKNTLFGGGMVLNVGAFFYDYKDYQVSKIVDRSANNENFDAKIWGLEFESVFAPNEDLRLNASLGYLDTELGEGSRSIDVMNRTAGRTDWVLMKPAITLTSNCIAPVGVAEIHLQPSLSFLDNPNDPRPVGANILCPGGTVLLQNTTGLPPFFGTLPDGSTYNPADYPEANYGAGFFTDVSGNELPNSPHWTVTFGGQYSWDLLDSNWRATVRGDAYWQSQSWARIYNLDPYDKLHGWYNANLSFWVERPADDLKIEFYIKNLLDDTPITDTFTNSDDTALTTNVFVLDPRLIGLSITKGF